MNWYKKNHHDMECREHGYIIRPTLTEGMPMFELYYEGQLIGRYECSLDARKNAEKHLWVSKHREQLT